MNNTTNTLKKRYDLIALKNPILVYVLTSGVLCHLAFVTANYGNGEGY